MRLTKANGDPVYEHYKTNSNVVFRVLQENIIGKKLAGLAEDHWINQYKANGCIMLNKRRGGINFGTYTRMSVSSDAVILDARKYATRCEWKIKNLPYYELARRRGIFVEATAHMPVLGPRPRQSLCTKQKIRAALMGHSVSAASKEAMSFTKFRTRTDKVARAVIQVLVPLLQQK